MKNLIIGFVFSTIISLAAYKKNSLSESGAIAAAIMGGLMYFFGGFVATALLIGFFVSASLLTVLNKSKKKDVVKLNEKGGRRDVFQVFANGGVGLLFAALFYFTKNQLFLVGCAISFGEANADTWASEVGVLSKKLPVSILTGKALMKGMSGGVSILGTFAALAGSTFMAVVFAISHIIEYGYDKFVIFGFIAAMVLGFFGAIIDSVLGASIQAQYYCEEENIITEQSLHNGKPNKLIKGFSFFNNDMINLSSNIISSIMIFFFI